MIKILQFALIISLFITSRVIISKVIGKRARKEIFSEIKGKNRNDNKWHKNKRVLRVFIIFFGMSFLAILNGYNVFFAGLIGSFAIVILFCIEAIKQKVCKKQVLCDLLNVSECLRVQISSQISLSNALRSLPELCVNKEFSGLLTNIYLEYELSKFIILDSAEFLQSKFNYPEIRIFISSLNQQIQGASAIEAFDNLIYVLRERYIEFLEEATKSKMAIMTMGVFIIVLNIAALGIYPVAVEEFNDINIMLK